MDESKEVSLEIQRLRRERDDAEARFAASQLQVTELQSQLRQQANTISDMKAEKKLVSKLPPAPKLKAEAVDIIEISDDEEDSKTLLACSVGPQDAAPSAPEKTSPLRPTGSPGPSTRPVSLKRPRSESPLPQPSEHRHAPAHHSRSTSPDLKPSVKRPKTSSRPLVTLPQSVINSYLVDTPNLDITPPPLSDLYVSRKFLSSHYGGNPMYFVVDFSLERKGRKAVFPEVYLNPLLPDQPGAPGLIYASREEIIDGTPWAVFCKKQSGKVPAVWRYMGDYVNERCGEPTPEEVRAQDDTITEKWAEHIYKTKMWDVYVEMRARIALRKAGRDIPKSAVDQEMKKIRKGGGLPVTMKDIIKALERGDEKIGIVRMKCVSYDHEFAAELAEKWADPPAPPPKPSGSSSSRRPSRSKKDSKRKIKGKGRAVASPRRTYESDADDDGDFDVEEEDADDGEWQPEGRQESGADVSGVRLSLRRPRRKRSEDDGAP
ncbi:hypothetical protein FB45DRAFT_1024750 [Roridomyces roridus]|uniref:DUF6697 domain-containing protein n=1 Tax=Roridomyces roridus TaxID=1738132 RepID=A0AAD7C1K5_9AGAR|nr:hypothetical protein FB45DRAFT_1024750 [Roridomyces roridus]